MIINNNNYIIAYDQRNGKIDGIVNDLSYADNYPQDFKDNLRALELSEYPENIFKHRVIDGQLVEMSDIELKEWRELGRILSEDERYEKEMIEKLTPTVEELQKANQTIEILSLIQEVI